MKTFKEIRLEQGKTVKQVAKDLNMNSSVLSSKESGARKWRLEEFVRLCEYYGVQMNEVNPQL